MDRLTRIFARQQELFEKFAPVETGNGFFVPVPPIYPDRIVDFHNQQALRDYAWRITEEIVEAQHAEGSTHCLEELVDAYHFFVEMFLVLGWSPADIYYRTTEVLGWSPADIYYRTTEALETVSPPQNYACMLDGLIFLVRVRAASSGIALCRWSVVSSLALAMNTLKNRPWKKPDAVKPVERRIFERNLMWAHLKYLELVFRFYFPELTAEQFFRAYMDKAATNDLRLQGD